MSMQDISASTQEIRLLRIGDFRVDCEMYFRCLKHLLYFSEHSQSDLQSQNIYISKENQYSIQLVQIV